MGGEDLVRRAALPILAAVLVAGGVAAWLIAGDDDEPSAPVPTVPAARPVRAGSLVSTSLESQVGVVLDELPRSMRTRVTESLLAEPEEFWIDRARSQIRMTTYRLVFRHAFYEDGQQALPLPPEPLWEIELVGEPQRHEVDGHDVVGVDYEFSSVLLADQASPGVAEPQLAAVGGTWDEDFVLPVDPEMVTQRTGYACMDEEAYPFNSVDSEEAHLFYDDTAVVESSLSTENYHYTAQPDQSCVNAVRDHIGRVETGIRYERLPWDPEVADRYRYGEATGPEPDLEVYAPEFEASRSTYRYIHETGSAGCELEEGSVGGSGWRRLLQFATSDANVGEAPLTIGSVDYTLAGQTGDLDEHNLFELSACHGHYHFLHYGQLGLTGADVDLNSKQAFCLQSTNRVHNRETSPLHNPFGDCDNQGVEAGWVDQYQAGLPSQWLDTTDVPTGTYTRTFQSNPDGLLCEGTFVDESGQAVPEGEPVVWGVTDFLTEDGHPVESPLCELSDEWDANNHEETETEVEEHGLGLITDECTRGQLGPRRNCGFGADPEVVECAAGEQTEATFRIPEDAEAQVVRLTEYSHALDTPIPARYEDSYVPLTPGVGDQPAMLANAVVVRGEPEVVTFRCPSPRDGGEPEPGGTYSIYTAPVFPGDDPAPVTSR